MWRRIEIFGHRGIGCSTVGGESPVPENSLAAFERAAALGIDGVELDVWMTKDERVVVVHGGGSDLDGFLCETVVDVEFCRNEYMKEEAKRITRTSSAPSLSKRFPGIQAAGQFAIGDRNDETRPSQTVVESTRRIRRIEEMNFTELQQAGHLQLRQPWSVYKSQDSKQKSFSSNMLIESLHTDSSSKKLSPSRSVKNHPKKSFVSHLTIPLREVTRRSFCTDCIMPVPEQSTSVELHILSRPSKQHYDSPDLGQTEEVVNEFWSMTPRQRKNALLEYQEHLQPHIEGVAVSEVPLLEDVFRRFHGRLRFNVELKGTNPKLGLKVLEIAKPYPNIIARISSFLWGIDLQVPGCGYSHNPDETNIVVADLLSPLLYEDIGIALLFGEYSLPPINKILTAIKMYKAEWIHLPQAFQLHEDDASKAEFFRREFLSLPRVIYLLKRVPLRSDKDSESSSSRIWDSSPSSLNNSSDRNSVDAAARNRNSDVRTRTCRETLLTECLHLYFLTREMHKHGRKVLTYSSGANEDKRVMELQLLCDIDGLCPNDVKTALLLSHRETRSRTVNVPRSRSV